MENHSYGKTDRLWEFVIAALFAMAMLGGCNAPRLRAGSCFGSPISMGLADPGHMGKHSYKFSLKEQTGLIYSLRGGFIDMGHLREAADRTAYLSGVAYGNLSAGEKEFSFRVIEPSRYSVRVSYPAGWDQMPVKERQRLAREASIPLGQYLAHKSLMWHEIITWYGFASTGVFSEKLSAFSFEDTYSDATGIYLAGKALRDPRRYDEAMTALIDERLKELDAQQPSVTHEAVNEIKGKWYTGDFYFFVDMTEPSFDVGRLNGYITPRLVPGVSKGAVAQTVTVPNLGSVTEMGFAVEVTIEPLIWEKDKMYRSIAAAGIKPELDFPELIGYISGQTRQPMAPVAELHTPAKKVPSTAY